MYLCTFTQSEYRAAEEDQSLFHTANQRRFTYHLEELYMWTQSELIVLDFSCYFPGTMSDWAIVLIERIITWRIHRRASGNAVDVDDLAQSVAAVWTFIDIVDICKCL